MRRADWVKRMWSAIESAKSSQFSLGSHDCCLFAARVVDAMRDGDIEERLLKEYSDEADAVAFLKSRGGMEAAVSIFLGEPAAAILARRGDVCLVDTQRGLGIGVSVGATIAVASDGVDFYPISAALKCWRVD